MEALIIMGQDQRFQTQLGACVCLLQEEFAKDISPVTSSWIKQIFQLLQVQEQSLQICYSPQGNKNVFISILQDLKTR